MSFCSSSTIIGLQLSVDVLKLKIGELTCTWPVARTNVLDLSFTVMNGKIITWFCKLMKTSSSTPHIKLVNGVFLSNQVLKTPLVSLAGSTLVSS